jgi:hypothetical protein
MTWLNCLSMVSRRLAKLSSYLSKRASRTLNRSFIPLMKSSNTLTEMVSRRGVLDLRRSLDASIDRSLRSVLHLRRLFRPREGDAEGVRGEYGVSITGRVGGHF